MDTYQRLRAASAAYAGELDGIVQAVNIGVRSIKEEAGAAEHATKRRALFQKRFHRLQQAAQQQRGAIDSIHAAATRGGALADRLAPFHAVHSSDSAHLEALQDYLQQFGYAPAPPAAPPGGTAPPAGATLPQVPPGGAAGPPGPHHPHNASGAARFQGREGLEPSPGTFSGGGAATRSRQLGAGAGGQAPAHAPSLRLAPGLGAALQTRGPALAPLSDLNQVYGSTHGCVDTASVKSDSSAQSARGAKSGALGVRGYESRVADAPAPAFDFAEIKARNDRLQALLGHMSGK